VLKKVDAYRKVEPGHSAVELERLAERRNRIVHRGDRAATKRSALRPRDVDEHLRNARSIVEALEATI
jgi:hypothetical protein